MIHYRPFLNSDPPGIADIWRSQPPLRGRLQNATPELLERFVFSKLYFDHDGLLLALDDQQPVGLAHAGFGPNEDHSGPSTECGVISSLLVKPHDQWQTIAIELLKQSEAYLQDRGATVLYAGGVENICPFYLGFYGGSQLPGILASDPLARQLFESAGYTEAQRYCIFQRPLAGFRSPVSRTQIQNRRRFRVVRASDLHASTWWEASTFAAAHRERFTVLSLLDKKPVGSATFWSIAPLADDWGERAAGLLNLEISTEARRKGLATFLMSEAVQQLASAGYTVVECQTSADDDAGLAVLKKLAFSQFDEGVVLRKVV